MTAPFGTSPWGTGAYGVSLTSIASAYATSTNEILVTATGPILQRSPALTGDSTNPSTWQVIRGDTNTIVPLASVAVVGPTQVSLRTVSPLPPQLVQLEVVTSNLLDATGALISSPRTALFQGVTEAAIATPELVAAASTSGARDLLNRQVPTADGSLTATLVVAGGDYVNETGKSLLRKLIIRRLLAAVGDFYHLPGYGCGLRVKEPLPVGDIVKLQARIKQQIMQERDVASVSVTITQSTNSMNVGVVAFMKSTGQRLDIGVPFQIRSAA